MVKIPHVGLVSIANSVSIGNCCTIDRGSLNTIISEHVIDNLCHIAHNVKIGPINHLRPMRYCRQRNSWHRGRDGRSGWHCAARFHRRWSSVDGPKWGYKDVDQVTMLGFPATSSVNFGVIKHTSP